MDSYKKSRRKSIIAWVIAFVLAIGAAIVSFTPFIFMVLNSFKEKFEMLTKGVFQLPDQLNWSNYTEVLTGGFANYFKNSVIVLAISLILLLFISASLPPACTEEPRNLKAGYIFPLCQICPDKLPAR